MANRGRPRKVPVVPEQKSEGQFSLVLLIEQNRWETKGDSIAEAVAQLKPEVIKAKAILKITNAQNGKEWETVFTPFKLKKLLVNEVARLLFEKRALLFLQ